MSFTTHDLVVPQQGDISISAGSPGRAAFALRSGLLADWTVFVLPRTVGEGYAATVKVEVRYLVGTTFELGSTPAGEAGRLPPRGGVLRAFGPELVVHVASVGALVVSVFAVPSRVKGFEVELDGTQNPERTKIALPFFSRRVFGFDSLRSLDFFKPDGTKVLSASCSNDWIPIPDEAATCASEAGEGPLKFSLID